MNHQHLPALNRYTSPNQYEALQEIDKTRSLTALLMKGSMSKTVGSLIRSAWIVADNYTDEQGVVREGWAVSDAGKHAMRIYEARVEEAKKAEEARQAYATQRKQKQSDFYELCKELYRTQLKADKLKQRAQLMAMEVYDSRRISDDAVKFVIEEAQYNEKIGNV